MLVQEAKICILYLFYCKLRLIKFFFNRFVELIIKGGLHYLFLYIIERYR